MIRKVIQRFLKSESHFLQLIALALASHFGSFILEFAHIDEGFWLLLSRHAWNGQLYLQLFDHKPPFLFQWTWLLSGGGNSIFLLHLSTSVVAGLSAWMLGSILKKEGAGGISHKAAQLFALTSGLTVLGAFSQERMIIFFCLLSYLGLLMFIEAKHSRLAKPWLGLIIAGLSAGAAIGIKQTALLLLGVLVYRAAIDRRAWPALITSPILATVFTFLTWSLSGVSWSVVWQDGYLANLTYASFSSFQTETGARLVIQDLLLSLGGLFCFLLIPAIAGIPKALQVLLKRPLRLGLIIVWSVMTIASVSLGGRFLQQYFYTLIPLLVVGASFWTGQSTKRWALVFFLNALLVIGWNGYGVWLQTTDRNKHNDQLTEKLVDEIQNYTSANDTIWISNSLHSIYYRAERLPAVKYLYFHSHLNFVDVCRVPEDQLTEEVTGPEWEDSLRRLKENPPKLIFWTQRASNSCSDRLKIENFPRLQEFLNKNYRLESSSDLGLLFLRL
jgi:hypothetical protein